MEFTNHAIFFPDGEVRRFRAPSALPAEVVQASALEHFTEEFGVELTADDLVIVPIVAVHVSGTVH